MPKSAIIAGSAGDMTVWFSSAKNAPNTTTPTMRICRAVVFPEACWDVKGSPSFGGLSAKGHNALRGDENKRDATAALCGSGASMGFGKSLRSTLRKARAPLGHAWAPLLQRGRIRCGARADICWRNLETLRRATLAKRRGTAQANATVVHESSICRPRDALCSLAEGFPIRNEAWV